MKNLTKTLILWDEKRTKVQKIIMTWKSLSFKKSNCNFIYMFAMAGQIARPNGLNFSKETHGQPWGWHKLNKF